MNLDSDMVMILIVVVGAWIAFKVISGMIKAVLLIALVATGGYFYLASGASF